jgi:glycosyltransferase involved in cell wall biosynthesis
MAGLLVQRITEPGRVKRSGPETRLVEANATSKPVIGGRSGGTAEAILHGQTGFLVDTDSIRAQTDSAAR